MAVGRRTVVQPYSNQAPMTRAILTGDMHKLKHLLANGEDVNYTDVERRGYLHLAAHIGASEMVKVLMESGCRTNVRDNEWLTPLHRACRQNHEDVVKILLENGADPNCRDRTWSTPLHVCAANNSLPCLKHFIDSVNNVNVSDRSGATALHHAAFNGHCDIISFLIQKGAETNCFDKKDRRPLHCAAAVDFVNAIRLLVSHKADVNVKDKELMTPLHIAAARGNISSVQLLIELGANYNSVDAHGYTPLHWCCLHGQDDVIDTLIDYGVDINAQSRLQLTPLHLAAASTTGTPALEILLMHQDKLDINAKDKFGRSALHFVARYGRISRVLDLLRCGAQINATDKRLQTPLHYASRAGHIPVVDILLSSKECEVNLMDCNGMTPLHLAAYCGFTDICKRLVYADGANPYLLDLSGRSALSLAALSSNLECLKFLHARSTEPTKLDSFNRSVIHYASASNAFDCLEYLLLKADLTFDVNQADVYGRTPLHYACCAHWQYSHMMSANMCDNQGDDNYDEDNDDSRCTNLLLQLGSKPNVKDNDGLFPVHYAASSGKAISLRSLIQYPCGINWSRTKFKLCPSYCSAYFGNSDCLQFLLTYHIYEDLGRAMEYATINGHVNCIQVIIQQHQLNKIPLDFSGSSNRSIHFAALKSLQDCLSHLISHVDDVDIQDDNKRTPLMMAALTSKFNYTCIELLLNRGAKVGKMDDCGRNVLFYATFSGHEDAVRSFFEHENISLNKRDLKSGKTCIHIAAAMGHNDVLHYLIGQKGVDFETLIDKERLTPIHWAAYKSQVNAMTILLECLKKNTFFGSKVSPLHLAALSASNHSMELLLSHFGPGIIHLRDAKKRSVVHFICMSPVENRMSLELILKLDVDVNAADDQNKTPLLHAIQNGHETLVQMLLDSGADLSLEDSKGNNALHYCCMWCRDAIGVKLLDKQNDLVNSTNADLKTPLHISSANGLFNLTQKLLLLGASVNCNDIDGLSPSLCCAKNSDVADCLMLIESIMMLEETEKLRKSGNAEMLINSNHDVHEDGNSSSGNGKRRHHQSASSNHHQRSASSLESRKSIINRKSAQIYSDQSQAYLNLSHSSGSFVVKRSSSVNVNPEEQPKLDKVDDVCSDPDFY